MSLSLAEARALHRSVPVIDLHADTPMLSTAAGYRFDHCHRRYWPKRGNCAAHVDAPRMRRGGVSGQIFGMWSLPFADRLAPATIHKQLDTVDRWIAESHGEIRRCFTGQDVREAHRLGKIAALCGIEGGQALAGRPEEVETFARRGVRYIGLLHFHSNALGTPAYGPGADDDAGLTSTGHQVIEEMNRLGVVVDLTHINRKGFFECIDVVEHAPMVSHTGVSGVHPHWRNIDDAQIRAVADKGGCIGLIFSRRFLGGKSIDHLCDHILHVIDVAGTDTPALGSDFDGFVVPPEGLEDISMLPVLTQALSGRGLDDNTLAKLLGGNALRVLDESQPPSHITGSRP